MGITAIGSRGVLAAPGVYVHESGTPDRPAIVFVHGGGPSGRMWRFHQDRLAARFHCLAPDLPGFGRSNRLEPLSLSETADLVAALIEARVPARRAHVVGLSYGGSVVLALLERHPDHVDRAVVDGAAVLPTWGGLGDRLVQPRDRRGTRSRLPPGIPARISGRLHGAVVAGPARGALPDAAGRR
jgi:pimeloyl-ACP methyl ester carboxylesterase